MDKITSKNTLSMENQCIPSKCLENEDKNHLICVLCKRKVHYECSELPAYEIQRIISSSSNSYKCITCVRVPKSLMKIMSQRKYKSIDKEMEEKDVIIKQLEHELNMKTNARNIIRNDLESFLTEKIKDIETKTRELIKEELSTTTKTITEASKQTYAQITHDNQKRINTISQNQILDNEREKSDIESRKCNIIMHKVKEDKDETEEEQRREDEKEVKELLLNVFDTNEEHINKIKITHERIGKKGDKCRPLKVTFFDEKQKIRLMNNLYRLKNIHAYNISITEDYTKNERMKIKEQYMKAKKLNEEANGSENYVWRVRGCPRTSLYLKRILWLDKIKPVAAARALW